MSITLDLKYIEKFIPQEKFSELAPRAITSQKAFNLGTGAGNERTGWRESHNLISSDDFQRLIICSDKIRASSDVVIVVGSGFAYIGAKAAIDWLTSPNLNAFESASPKILFLGQDMCAFDFDEVFSQCEGKNVSMIAVNDAETSPETAISMRLAVAYMKKRYGDACENRIFIVESNLSGANAESDEKKFETFNVPSDIVGGFALFTAAGLLPMACAGVDIKELFEGLNSAVNEYQQNDIQKNPALIYSILRYALYQQGFAVEMLCGWNGFMNSSLHWASGLLSSACGRNSKGLVCSNFVYPFDVYPMGQFVEKGSKILFETMFSVDSWGKDKSIEPLEAPNSEEDFLVGRTLSSIARDMEKEVASAHHFSGIPVARIVLGRRNAHDFGEFVYFMQYTAAISAYLFGVNPFDEETSEKFAKNTFGMLGKPGCDKPRLL